MERLIANLTAYHLSSNSFDKFDLSKAEEERKRNGDVEQCIYGYGMYLTNTKDEALGFKNQIDNAKYLYTVSINGALKDFIDWFGNNSHLKKKCELLLKNNIKEIVVNELEKCTSRTGLNNVLCRYNLDKYTLEDENKLSSKEKESVISDVKKETKIDFDIEDIINFDNDIYEEVYSLFNKDHKTTSKMFVSVGIIGIKANNYLVVFDMDNVTIVNKEEI